MNFNKKEDLLSVLMELEFSFPAINNFGPKPECPQCGETTVHTKDCKLNNVLLTLLSNKWTLEIKEEAKKVIRNVEWVGWKNICPLCVSRKHEGHKPGCKLKGANDERK